MKLGKFMGVVFTIMVMSMTAEMPASAALPEFLPEATEKTSISFTGKISKPEFRSGATVVLCEKATAKGQVTSLKLGTVSISFEGCFRGFVECMGLSDKIKGNITIEGEFHIWRGFLVSSAGISVEHKAVLALLSQHLHLTCGGGIVLVLVLGILAGLLKEVNKKAKILSAEFVENAKKTGVNDITEVENDKGEKIKVGQKASANETMEELPWEPLMVLTMEGFTQIGQSIEVEVMA